MKKHKKKLTQLHCLCNSFSQAKLFLMSIKEDLRQRDDVNGLVLKKGFKQSLSLQWVKAY